MSIKRMGWVWVAIDPGIQLVVYGTTKYQTQERLMKKQKEHYGEVKWAGLAEKVVQCNQ